MDTSVSSAAQGRTCYDNRKGDINEVSSIYVKDLDGLRVLLELERMRQSWEEHLNERSDLTWTHSRGGRSIFLHTVPICDIDKNADRSADPGTYLYVYESCIPPGVPSVNVPMCGRLYVRAPLSIKTNKVYAKDLKPDEVDIAGTVTDYILNDIDIKYILDILSFVDRFSIRFRLGIVGGAPYIYVSRGRTFFLVPYVKSDVLLRLYRAGYSVTYDNYIWRTRHRWSICTLLNKIGGQSHIQEGAND